MKTIIAISLAIALSGCSQFTPAQRDFAATVGYRVIDLFQVASDIFVQVIVARATSPEDASDKANWLDSVAGGLRSLQTTSGDLVSANEVGVAIREFTDPNKAQWSELAKQLSTAYEKSLEPDNVALEALATAANAQAATLRAAQ